MTVCRQVLLRSLPPISSTMSESEPDKTESTELCLNFKGNGDTDVGGFLRDPSRVGHHRPKTLKVTGLALTKEQSLEQEDGSDESSTVNTENRMYQIFVSCLRLHSITKLEVTDTTLDVFLINNSLTFCNLTNLEELRLVSTRLKSLPYSLGCLKKLRTLDVSNNDIRALPDTIVHCTELCSIDISHNRSFGGFPGWIMELPHLKTFKTVGTRNNTITWSGGEANVYLSRTAARESRSVSPTATGDVVVHVPSSLEQLAAGTVARSALSMDHLYCLPTNLLQQVEGFMQEKTLYICAHCKKLLLKEDGLSTIYILAFRYGGMKNFSMEFRACTGTCDQAVETRLREWQTETRKELDREYEEMVRKANEEFGMDRYYAERIAHLAKFAVRDQNRFRRRRQRCVCM